MNKPLTVEFRSHIVKELAEQEAKMRRAQKHSEPFNFQRMLTTMAGSGQLTKDCPEAAACERAANLAGEEFNPHSPVVPWAAFARRDLTVSNVVGGKTLVGADTAEAADVLRPFSLAARLGIEIVQQDKNNLLIPRVGLSTTGTWLATESSNIGGNDPSIGQTEAKPKVGGALLRGGHRFLKSSPQGVRFIQNQLAGAMGDLLDQAVLSGTGATGQPLGLKYMPGIGVITGTFDRTKALTMEQTVSGVVGDDSPLAFVTTPEVRKSIKEIQLGTSGRYLWNDTGLVDRPGHVSRNCPADTMFIGDWSKGQIVLWGGGPKIEIDPYSNFRTGAIDFRILMWADVYFNPMAFFTWTAV